MIEKLIQAGEPVEHRGIVVLPLFPRRDPSAAYTILDDALARGLVVREVDGAGRVPELVVENPLAERVLLYDGEELVGAKQNRILNVSVLVEARSTLTVPVSCVEEGRWRSVSARFRPGSHVSHARLRRRKAEAQAARPLALGIAQSEVWMELHERMASWAVPLATRASADLYRSRDRDLRALEGAFPALPGQCGALLALGRDLCLDYLSRPDAFARLWPKLRAGYLLDALERLDGAPAAAEDVQGFLAALDAAEASRRPSPGLGEDVRLRGEGVLGSGLELEGELLQLSAFTSGDGGRRAFGRIARPSERAA
ncbi:MAG TPA: DUF6569 family protein [Gaiellaceae bacterium]|nr:DUF6569 family protein [Gaiellaceae bacterium]